MHAEIEDRGVGFWVEKPMPSQRGAPFARLLQSSDPGAPSLCLARPSPLVEFNFTALCVPLVTRVRSLPRLKQGYYKCFVVTFQGLGPL